MTMVLQEKRWVLFGYCGFIRENAWDRLVLEVGYAPERLLTSCRQKECWRKKLEELRSPDARRRLTIARNPTLSLGKLRQMVLA